MTTTENTHDQLAAAERGWLARERETKSPEQLLEKAYVIVDLLGDLHCGLDDTGHAHGWLCEHASSVGLTDDEFNAARAHLALHHEIVGVISSMFERCQVDPIPPAAPVVARELRRIFNTDGLGYRVLGEGYNRRQP